MASTTHHLPGPARFLFRAKHPLPKPGSRSGSLHLGAVRSTDSQLDLVSQQRGHGIRQSARREFTNSLRWDFDAVSPTFRDHVTARFRESHRCHLHEHLASRIAGISTAALQSVQNGFDEISKLRRGHRPFAPRNPTRQERIRTIVALQNAHKATPLGARYAPA